MSYAIIETGGKQYKVGVGDFVDVERLPIECAQSVEFSRVLLVSEGGQTRVGSPIVEGYVVRGELVDDWVAGPKIKCMKYKPRKRLYKQWGHRQHYSRVKITEIQKV